MKNFEKYYKELVIKSNEAFIMAIEIINKPTINYRTEGFLFFICNAWELLLKARIFKEHQDIKKINGEKDKTLGITKCLELLHPKHDDEIKNSLRFIIELRNISTHLILPEYDVNFSNDFKMISEYYYKYVKKYFNEENTFEMIKPYISISVAPYNNNTSDLFLNNNAKIIFNDFKDKGTTIVQTMYVTNNPDEPDFKIKYDNDSGIPLNQSINSDRLNNEFVYRTTYIIKKVKKI